MKNNLTLRIALICIVLGSAFWFGCKKEVGDQGAKGEQGIAGTAGSTVLSGNTAPAATLGVTGDFYLDLSTSNFYGPKKAEGWGTPFSMKGATGSTGTTGAAGTNGTNGVNGTNGTNGTNGAAGSQILSGTATPAATVGAVGDYFLDKTTYNLYGPKTVAGWGTALSLKGTANVLYSGWNYAKTFRDTVIDNSNLKAADLAAPALTSAVLNGASIQVYLNYVSEIFALPYINFAGGKSNTINFIPRLGRFTMTRFTADNSNAVSLSTTIQYRYVIIPGGTALSLAKQNKLDLSDYEAVKKYYHIPD